MSLSLPSHLALGATTPRPGDLVTGCRRCGDLGFVDCYCPPVYKSREELTAELVAAAVRLAERDFGDYDSITYARRGAFGLAKRISPR